MEKEGSYRVHLRTVLQLIAMLGLLSMWLYAKPIRTHAETAHYLNAYQAYNLDIYSGDINKSFEMMGTKYRYGVAPSNWSGSRQADFLLDKEFSSVTFSFGAVGTHDANSELRIYRDGKLGETYPLTPQMTTKTYTINTNNVMVLRFDFYGGYGSFYGIADVIGHDGHIWDYDNRLLTKSPTRTAKGEYTYTCKVCGTTKKETIASQAVCKPDLIPYSYPNLAYRHEFKNAVGDPNPSSFKIMGRTWKTGVFSENWTTTRTALYNLSQNYKSVSFMVGHEDGKNPADAVLNLYKDEAGTPFQIIQLTAGMSGKRVSVDVSGITQLKLEITSGDSGNFYALYDFQYTWIDNKEHDFVLTSETPATTSTNGSKVYTCKDCNFVESVLVPKTGKPVSVPTVKSVKCTAYKNKIVVNYKKASGVTGYEVTWSLKKKSGYCKKPVVSKTTKAVIRKLKSKKTYYVKVRAYKIVNGKKYYGSYTSPVKIKTK